MPEEQAFSVMVKILYNYKHRDLFKANFQNLHLMFYQLDKLLLVSLLIRLSCLYVNTEIQILKQFPLLLHNNSSQGMSPLSLTGQ